MEHALALLRLALERGWTLGLLMILFFGLALWAPPHGYPFPEIVTEWANAGIDFGIAAFVVSILANLIRFLGSFIERRRDVAELRRDQRREAQGNLDLLEPDERMMLVDLLKLNHSRFTVQISDPAYALLYKGVLEEVRKYGGAGWVCELHPGIVAMRDELLRKEGCQCRVARQRGS
jgi:hypothetical protein